MVWHICYRSKRNFIIDKRLNLHNYESDQSASLKVE
jgi:hypothetical protein